MSPAHSPSPSASRLSDVIRWRHVGGHQCIPADARDCYWWRRLANRTRRGMMPRHSLTFISTNCHHRIRAPITRWSSWLRFVRSLILFADTSTGFRWRADSGDYCCALASGHGRDSSRDTGPELLANDPTALELICIANSVASCAHQIQPNQVCWTCRANWLPADHRRQDHRIHPHRR